MKSKHHSFAGKKVLVIGLGISGQAAARFLLNRGATVIAVDRNESLAQTQPSVAALCREGLHLISEKVPLPDCDLVVVSPGIPQTHSLYREALERGVKLIGEVELACGEMHGKCLAVTGTNGKTTVTLLVEHVLKSVGKKAKALGNVGIPITAVFDDNACDDIDIFVLELSSFQLETLEHRFVDAGVLLNVTPDHLDRYASMEEYAIAKIRMKDNLKSGGKFFVEENCYREYRKLFGESHPQMYGYSACCDMFTDLKKIYFKGVSEMTLPSNYCGKHSHDVENLMAAFALCREVGINGEQFLAGLSTFKKPAHRLEFVRTHAGVHYIDDSKGTNIDAVIRALQVVEGKIVLIAGGVDKGFPYTSWIQPFAGKVTAVCAIGQSKEKIRNELGQHVPVTLFVTLQDAVNHASKIALPGQTVLLSPGCSSYDMFRDYAQRGSEFQRIINALQEE